MHCAIGYPLYNFKNLESTHGGALRLANCRLKPETKSNTTPWVFSRFLNCTNGTKSRKASHLSIQLLLEFPTVKFGQLPMRQAQQPDVSFFIYSHF